MHALLVYITTQDKSEARKIGAALVEKRLAACVNILDGMESLYRWEGKLEEGRECVLIAKTMSDKMPELQKVVLEMHSYSCPCVVSFRMESGNPDYLNWIAEECQGPDA